MIRPGAIFETIHRQRNRKSGELLAVVRNSSCGRRIETRQSQRAAEKINEGDHPANPRKLEQHDPIHHQRWREPEGDHIRQRIELASEGAVVAP